MGTTLPNNTTSNTLLAPKVAGPYAMNTLYNMNRGDTSLANAIPVSDVQGDSTVYGNYPTVQPTTPTIVQSGGLGTYGSYNGVGLDKPAYNAIQNNMPSDGSLLLRNSTTIQPQSGGLGDYGQYNGVGVNKAAYDRINATGHGGTLARNGQQPQGMSGWEKGLGLANVGLGVGGLAVNAWAANENRKAQSRALDYAKKRDNKADAKTAKFQRNLV